MVHIIGGIVVAYITLKLSYRAFAMRIRQLEERCLTQQKTIDTLNVGIDISHEANLRIQRNNADLLELVERQGDIIAKLQRGNRDVPARDN